jgi:DNA-binding response OmpR family regulator
VRKHEYDVVLMDIQMPELDGIQATKQIRALPPPACNAYIVAMTANAMSGARDEYVAAGMNDYVSKPIDSKSLLARLAALPNRVPAANHMPVVVELPVARPGGDAEKSAIDKEKLGELLRYLPISNVIDLIILFTAESNSHAMRIKNYLAEKDHQSIAREAHILVSTAGNIGAMNLSAVARTLEHACKDGKVEDLGRLVGELDRGISAANAAFEAWMAANGRHHAATQKCAR